jgi:DNA helicase-2/ATP-dependent DNA helicase PcrA
LYNIALEYESLKPQGALADFIRYLSLMGQFDLELEEDYWAEDAVQVTTIHQSKGREFAVVFVADVAANKFPQRYREKAFYVPNDLSKGVKRDEDEMALYVQEERRLLYVAMTRAQSRLFLTYAKRYGQNARETKPSKFLDEIAFSKNLRVEVVAFDSTKSEASSMQTGDRLEKAVRSISQMQLKSAVQRIIELAKVKHFEKHGTVEGFDPASVTAVDNTDTNLDLGLVGKKVPLINRDGFRLSATKVDTYIECPLKFKFMYVQEAPQPPTKYFELGKAVHSVAEHITKMQAEGMQPTEELALDILKKKWNSEAFKSKTEEMQSREKGREMIRTYLR